MKYIVIITKPNGKQTVKRIEAENSKQAHEHADKLATNGATVRVFIATQDKNGAILLDGVQEGARMVIRRITVNMIKREGHSSQYTLYNQAHTPHPELFPDIADMVSVATLAIIEGIQEGLMIDEQYHRAYASVNNYLYHERAIRIDERPAHIYLEDESTGDIISVNKGINKLVSQGQIFIEDGDELASDKAQAIIAIMATLTPTQKQVVKYLAKGYSERQVAKEMKRSAPTIHEHIKAIRNKASTLYPNGADDYLTNNND